MSLIKVTETYSNAWGLSKLIEVKIEINRIKWKREGTWVNL